MAKKLKWGTIEYLETLIDEYFEASKGSSNIAGLCRALNISRDCWHYYTTERWRVFRKSEDELEAAIRYKEESLINEAFENLMEISDKGDNGTYDNIEDDNIKALVSDALKKAQIRIDEAISTKILTANNPAGAIFYAKAALGYRETDPGESQQAISPTKITINILPQPQQPMQIIEAVPTAYSVLPDKATK